MSKIVVISPSGRLYGSERVLLNYLATTKLSLRVMIPRKGELYEKINALKKSHTISFFDSGKPYLLYCRIFFGLLTGKYRSVYLNEAGHIKYILLLAKNFPRKRFTVHVRMLEDTAEERWQVVKNGIPKNLTAIAISDYIAKHLIVENLLIPDPFCFSSVSTHTRSNPEVIHIGIVGRIALNKGIDLLPIILAEMEERKIIQYFFFHMFGDLSPALPETVSDILKNNKNVQLHGYIKETVDIYTSLDAVMHLCSTEALGRTFFESINYGLPFIGIAAGGIGEIANTFNYKQLMVEMTEPAIAAKQLVDRMVLLLGHYDKYVKDAWSLKKDMESALSVSNYTQLIDTLIDAY